ncbi:hypothetical protein [Kordia sp.]|uniref:hypothetical protein n=1 Tax=Kordia sp. TaxID=1965332 RepID=UPI003D2E4B79
MGKFCLVIVSFCLMSMISCSNQKKGQQNDLIDVNDMTYSIEEKFTKYADSINKYNPKTNNIPFFIIEYYNEFDDEFKSIYNIHKKTPDSRKKSVYSDLFFKCRSEQLELIRAELMKKKNITNQDSLIINIIEYVINNKDG